MIPVARKNEPVNFDVTVRQPGQIFLAVNPNPADDEWKGKEYWQKSLSSMRTLYNETCGYCASWIPHSTGSHSVDHFKSKSVHPALAYEWNNFRYVSARFNSRKGIKRIADPFIMKFNWFVIDFKSFFIKPNSRRLGERQKTLAKNTIAILKLNDDDELVKERQAYCEDYHLGHIDFDYLLRKAPFIASELKRQGLD